MKRGQIHGPAKKKVVAGGRMGDVDGRRARRSLNAVFARRRRRSDGGYSGAPPRRRRQQLVGRCRLTEYLVAQARDTVAPPTKSQSPKIPQAAPLGETPHKPTSGAAPPSEDANAPWPPAELGIGDWMQDWLARANREFQTTVIRRLSTAPAGGASDDEIARKLAEVKKQDARAAAAKRAEDERKAAEAKEAEQVKRQAAEAKRLRETREAAEKAAQKAAEEASRKAAAEAAQKAAEEAKAKPPPPPAPQPAAKPDDSARLAEEMRQERARLEAEASRIEEERKAAEARRYAEERAQDESRIAEDRRRAPPRKAKKIERGKSCSRPNRSRSPSHHRSKRRLRPPPEVRGNPRAAPSASANGPVVRRWVWRAGTRRCRHAGRRVTPPGRYTVRHGDTLWLISKRHYHTGWLYRKIYRANRSVIRDPDLIYPCQQIFVPRRR